jgi:pimeloyl-ACP methyl ester carboxylesterase
MTHRLRRLLLAGLASALLVLPAGPVGAAQTPQTAPGSRPSAVILIGGLCSSLDAGALPAAFNQPNGLAARLRTAGWTADEILAYSYRGGSVDGSGRWVADPYDCDDTRDRTIAQSVEVLDAQVRAYLTAHPGAEVHVAGFSQGGLVAFAYLALLQQSGTWTMPAGGRLASIVSLDSPLGGLPFIEAACGLVGDVCAASEPGPPPPSLADMETVWNNGTGASGVANPAGADRSVGRLFGLSLTNQALANAAVGRGVAVLSIGNVRDWVYAPIGLFRSFVNFTDTQWFRSGAAGSGVYARVIDSGPETCPSGDANAASCNHGRVLTDRVALDAVVATLTGRVPATSTTCPVGRGGCLTLQPRPPSSLSSSIARGVVSTADSGFTTGSVKVPAGTRVTLRFVGGRAVAGAKVEIWTRSKTGSYHLLTTRVADSTGAVRYYAPPVNAWTAYQGRFAGSLTYGPSVSPGRVADIR